MDLEDVLAETLVGQAIRLPSTRIANLRAGELARVVGTPRPHGAWLVAPISRRPCAWWRLELSVWVARGRHLAWQRLTRLDDGSTFALRDDSGARVIDASAATIHARMAREWTFFAGRPPPEIVAGLDALGIALDVGGLARIRCTEASFGFDELAMVAGVPGDDGFDARHDLLVSTTRGLDPPALAGRPGWGLPAAAETVGAVEAPPVDEYEARLRARGRAWRLGVALAAVLAVLALALAAIAATRPRPSPALASARRREIEAAIAHTRAELDRPGCGAPDGCWHRALADRPHTRATDAACEFAPLFRERGDDIAIDVVRPDELLPARSPRTRHVTARLAQVEAALAIATDADAAELLDDASRLDNVDVLVQVHAGGWARAWAYDHGLARIACAGMVVRAPADPSALADAAIASLRQVAFE